MLYGSLSTSIGPKQIMSTKAHDFVATIHYSL